MMRLKQCNSNPFLKFVFIIIPLVLFVCCEKHKIKKHYTGSFHFITFKTDCSDYFAGYDFCGSDTTDADGSIEYIDDNVLLIKTIDEQFVVNVDLEGNLTLYSSYTNTNPHQGENLSGKFDNDNEVSFIYNSSYSFSGVSSWDKRSVRGTRL